jgi:uncharacterized protein (TIGR00299 family) protein
LVDAGVELPAIQAGIDSLGLPDCRLMVEEVKRHGFRATNLTVQHQPEHAHRHLHHITDMIDASALAPRQKEIATRIFTKLGEAEAKVHGTTIRKVHFHEVGAVDSIADIVGTAIGLDLLGCERIACSPIPTGTGYIEIAHGRCSVPAPATAELLRGIPLAPSNVEAELTTPTGAAIVGSIVDEFGPLPAMSVQQIGYGAGDRDLDQQANVLRLIVGTSDLSSGSDQVIVLETNLDDVTGEVVGYCTELLLAAGALDVYATAIQMKKNRPGVKLSVLCAPADQTPMEEILFSETSTLGVRRWTASRTKLRRRAVEVSTPWGTVAGKLAELPGGQVRFSPELDHCRQLALDHRLPLQEVLEAARVAFAATQP